jgi:hypothetical protein
VIAYGFILAFGRAGFVTMLLAALGADPNAIGGAIYTMPGLAFAYAYYLDSAGRADDLSGPREFRPAAARSGADARCAAVAGVARMSRGASCGRRSCPPGAS